MTLARSSIEGPAASLSPLKAGAVPNSKGSRDKARLARFDGTTVRILDGLVHEL